MRENLRLNYVVIMISGRGLAYKCDYVLSIYVGYKTRSYCIKPSSNEGCSGFTSKLQLQNLRCKPTSPSVSSQSERTLELPTSQQDNVWKPVHRQSLLGFCLLTVQAQFPPHILPMSNLLASSIC